MSLGVSIGEMIGLAFFCYACGYVIGGRKKGVQVIINNVDDNKDDPV